MFAGSRLEFSSHPSKGLQGCEVSFVVFIVCLFVYLFICLFVCLFIYLFMNFLEGILRLRVGSIIFVFGWGVNWMGAVGVAAARQGRVTAARCPSPFSAPSISRGSIITANQAQTALQNQGE